MTRAGQQNGFILLPVVLAITLIATIAFLINTESAINVDMTADTAAAVEVEQVARAGLAHATWGAQNSGCAGDMSMATVPFGPGNYTATVDSAATTTIHSPFLPDQDTWIDGNNTIANHAGSTTLRVKNDAAGGFRGLTHFDLSSITAGSRVATATLWLYVTDNDPDGVINVHPVTAAWTEADATWDSIGDSYDSQVFGTIAPQPAAGAWVSLNLTALTQSWVNDASKNHGLMLIAASDNELSQYSSKEYGTANLRPYLEITTADGPVSPVSINATGTLTGNPSPANDITRTITRNAVSTHQPATRWVSQPGVEGKDAYLITGGKSDMNTGSGKQLWVSSGGSAHNALVEFNLANLPPGARVLSATLDLYNNGTDAATDGVLSVHRITRGWEEGTGVQTGTLPADGVSWDAWDGVTAWTTPGGDYDPLEITSAPVPDLTARWYPFDITSLVADWVNGTHPNHGVLVRASGGSITKLHFVTGDDAPNPTLHPKLTITYACECGSPCLGPQGSGTILMVVVNPSTLVPADAYKKALFESWGYTVVIHGESENQASYDTAVSAADVVFISESVNSSQVGTKLVNAPIGVVSQEGTYNDDLGISNYTGVTVGSSINVIDTSHYITALFPAGPLDIYSADMELLAIFNGPAPDLQTLADISGNSSLVTVEAGATLKYGMTAAGRRVMLPLGSDTRFNWDYLNSNGRLIMQRALQWGMGATSGVPSKNLLFVSGGIAMVQFPSGDLLAIPTAQEQLRIDLIESWGYSVNLIANEDTQANFDAAIAANDVAYVSSLATETALGTKLTAANIGVINEQAALVDEFGFGAQSVIYKSRIEIDVLDNTHYITQPFPTGLLTLFTGNQTLHLMTANKGPGYVALGQVFNTGSFYDDSLGVIETGGELYGGGTAAGRRVLLPWGDNTFDVAALNMDGQTLMQRAIEWAEGAGSAPVPGLNILLIVGNATTLASKDVGYKALMESWSHTVTLIDDGDSQTNYDAAMAAADVVYASGSALGANMLDKATNTTKGLVNEVVGKIDNFGFSSTTSTVNTDTFSKTDPSHYITDPFSGNPVTVFTTSLTNPVPGGTLAPDLSNVGEVSGTLALGTLATGATRYDSNPSPGRRAHLPFAAAETTDLTADGETILQRALEWAAGAGAGGGGGGGTPASCDGTYIDQFNAVSYTGSDGTLTWAIDWLESSDSGGASGGDEQVSSDLGDNRLSISNKNNSIEREADLDGATTATLSLDYRRNGLDTAGDSITLEVSGDGGGSWSPLETFAGSGNDTAYVSTSHDITGFIAPNTRIRLVTSGTLGKNDGVFFDNVQIQCVP